MTTPQLFRPVLALIVALAAAACGGGSSDATAAGDGGGAAQSATVAIADSTFEPGEVTIAAGGTVEWSNDDSLPHTVTFSDDAVESSDQLDEGDTFSATFEQAGTFDYVCGIHPDMTGTVTVQ